MHTSLLLPRTSKKRFSPLYLSEPDWFIFVRNKIDLRMSLKRKSTKLKKPVMVLLMKAKNKDENFTIAADR
jgi:hypothetical protein